MAAIITDQIRILNAKNFVAGVSTSTNSYYSFVGLTDPAKIQSDWDNDPPSPIDNLPSLPIDVVMGTIFLLGLLRSIFSFKNDLFSFMVEF